MPLPAMQRNASPFIALVGAWTVSTLLVTPEKASLSVRLIHTVLPLGRRCHSRLGAGSPTAVTLKVVVPPAATLVAAGLLVKLGA